MRDCMCVIMGNSVVGGSGLLMEEMRMVMVASSKVIRR